MEQTTAKITTDAYHSSCVLRDTFHAVYKVYTQTIWRIVGAMQPKVVTPLALERKPER